MAVDPIGSAAGQWDDAARRLRRGRGEEKNPVTRGQQRSQSPGERHPAAPWCLSRAPFATQCRPTSLDGGRCEHGQHYCLGIKCPRPSATTQRLLHRLHKIIQAQRSADVNHPGPQALYNSDHRWPLRPHAVPLASGEGASSVTDPLSAERHHASPAPRQISLDPRDWWVPGPSFITSTRVSPHTLAPMHDQ
jgi:hypothetical protein